MVVSSAQAKGGSSFHRQRPSSLLPPPQGTSPGKGTLERSSRASPQIQSWLFMNHRPQAISLTDLCLFPHLSNENTPAPSLSSRFCGDKVRQWRTRTPGRNVRLRVHYLPGTVLEACMLSLSSWQPVEGSATIAVPRHSKGIGSRTA